MAHAIERDPEQAAKYHELHEAHKRNPEGYKKLYPNFFGFLYATFRMQLEAAAIEKQEKTEKQAIPLTPVQPMRVVRPVVLHPQARVIPLRIHRHLAYKRRRAA